MSQRESGWLLSTCRPSVSLDAMGVEFLLGVTRRAALGHDGLKQPTGLLERLQSPTHLLDARIRQAFDGRPVASSLADVS